MNSRKRGTKEFFPSIILGGKGHVLFYRQVEVSTISKYFGNLISKTEYLPIQDESFKLRYRKNRCKHYVHSHIYAYSTKHLLAQRRCLSLRSESNPSRSEISDYPHIWDDNVLMCDCNCMPEV